MINLCLDPDKKVLCFLKFICSGSYNDDEEEEDDSHSSIGDDAESKNKKVISSRANFFCCPKSLVYEFLFLWIYTFVQFRMAEWTCRSEKSRREGDNNKGRVGLLLPRRRRNSYIRCLSLNSTPFISICERSLFLDRREDAYKWLFVIGYFDVLVAHDYGSDFGIHHFYGACKRACETRREQGEETGRQQRDVDGRQGQ